MVRQICNSGQPTSGQHLSVVGIKLRAFARLAKAAGRILLGASRPAAVARFVIAVWIGMAVNAFAVRPLSHVGEKVFKNHPTLADFDSATAVVFVPDVVWFCASQNHVTPRYISSARRMAVFSFCGGGSFLVEAAAALRQPANEACSDGHDFVSADTSTVPTKVLATPSCKHQDCKSAECFANEIPSLRPKGCVRIRNSHEIVLSREGRLWLEPADVCAFVRLASFYSESLNPATIS